MGLTTMALLVSAPMQFAAAAGVELSGGYDSTVPNFTLSPPQWVDGGILRTAVDIQAGHRTVTLQQILRVRGEMFYAGGDGRSLDDANLMALTRYNLRWAPDDDWRFDVNAGYNIGLASMLVQGGAAIRGTPFQYGTFGEYLALAQVTRTFQDRYRLMPFGGVNGRHTVDAPPGTPRGDMITYRAGISSTVDVGDRDTFGVALNGERLGMAGLGDWIHRVTVFGLWRHAWTDTFGTGVSGGIDTLQDQTDPLRERWNVGPYATLVLTQVVPEARLAFTLAGRYEFTTVNSVACGGPLRADGTCPPDQVIAGGVGRVGGGTIQFIWRPLEEGHLTVAGIATADYGITENFVRAMGRVLPQTRPVGNMNVTASLNARWTFNRMLSAFARYTFLFQHVEEPVTFQDVRRHLILAGVTVSFAAGEADYLDGVLPWQEAEIAHAIRGAVASAPGAEAVAEERSAAGEDPGVLDDPLDPGDRPPPRPLRRPGEPDPEPHPIGDPRRSTNAPTGVTSSGSNSSQPQAPVRPREGSEGPNG
jgi:hypothetical protein